MNRALLTIYSGVFSRTRGIDTSADFEKAAELDSNLIRRYKDFWNDTEKRLVKEGYCPLCL